MKKSVFKPVIALLLALCLLMCGCSGGPDAPTTEVPTSPHDSDRSFTVAVLQFDNDYASNEMREKFIARMRTLGYDEAKMKFDIFSAHGSIESLVTKSQSLIGAKYRLIIAVGSAAAKAVADTKNEIPCIFIGAVDPEGSSLTSKLDVPDMNLTGSAFRTSSETLLSVMRVYAPTVTKIAAVYLPEGETDAKTVKQTLEENAYTVTLNPISSADALAGEIGKLSDGIDAFYIPNGSWSDSVIQTAAELCQEQNKIIITSNESFVEAGALTGAFTSSSVLAEEAALCADKVLQGELVSSVPIKADLEISVLFNSETAGIFEIETPTSDNLILF